MARDSIINSWVSCFAYIIHGGVHPQPAPESVQSWYSNLLPSSRNAKQASPPNHQETMKALERRCYIPVHQTLRTDIGEDSKCCCELPYTIVRCQFATQTVLLTTCNFPKTFIHRLFSVQIWDISHTHVYYCMGRVGISQHAF
jgi:hypothetical protein